MTKRTTIGLTRVGLALAFGIAASAGLAAPPSGPEIDPREANNIPAPQYGMPISSDLAETALAAAKTKAEALGFHSFTIAITEPDGSLVLFEKVNGATYVSVQFAMAKARTASISRRPTGPGPGGSMMAPTPDLIALPGGFPIIVGDKTVGGIGISGTEGGDVAIAKAALAAIGAR